jgi:stress-induced morphogen
MISTQQITDYLQRAFPDAEVALSDKTGTMDHYRLSIVSEAFHGKNRLDRQRMVYAALQEPMSDGRIHALEIQSRTGAEAASN